MVVSLGLGVFSLKGLRLIVDWLLYLRVAGAVPGSRCGVRFVGVFRLELVVTCAHLAQEPAVAAAHIALAVDNKNFHGGFAPVSFPVS